MKHFKLQGLLLLFALSLAAFSGQLTAADTGSITGNVYCDLDKNGICDCEEGGLKGIHVNIYTDQCGGVPLQRAATDEEGNFAFLGFNPGTYFVLVDLAYVCGGRVPTTRSCRQVTLVDGETLSLPAFGYSELGQ